MKFPNNQLNPKKLSIVNRVCACVFSIFNQQIHRKISHGKENLRFIVQIATNWWFWCWKNLHTISILRRCIHLHIHLNDRHRFQNQNGWAPWKENKIANMVSIRWWMIWCERFVSPFFITWWVNGGRFTDRLRNFGLFVCAFTGTQPVKSVSIQLPRRIIAVPWVLCWCMI